MAGGTYVYDVALGLTRHYAGLAAAATGAIILIPLEAAGMEAEATAHSHATVAAVLAGSTNEQTTLGRKTLASITSTVNTTAREGRVDAADPTWASAAGSDVGALLIAYAPTGGSPDSDLVPLHHLSWDVVGPTGSLTPVFDALGFYGVSDVTP